MSKRPLSTSPPSSTTTTTISSSDSLSASPSANPTTTSTTAKPSRTHPSLPASKISRTSPPLSPSSATTTPLMECLLPPHPPLAFPSYAAYDVHYAQAHANRCAECGRNLPTAWWLELHIAENHDPLVGVRRGRGEKVYHCFLPECDKVCATPQKRRLHLVDKHQFPKNYDFQIVNTGIDRRLSMLRLPPSQQQKQHRRRRSSGAKRAWVSDGVRVDGVGADGADGEGVPDEKEEDGSGEEEGDGEERDGEVVVGNGRPGSFKRDEDMDALASGLEALRFVPPSVRFGRGGRRGGLARS